MSFAVSGNNENHCYQKCNRYSFIHKRSLFIGLAILCNRFCTAVEDRLSDMDILSIFIWWCRIDVLHSGVFSRPVKISASSQESSISNLWIRGRPINPSARMSPVCLTRSEFTTSGHLGSCTPQKPGYVAATKGILPVILSGFVSGWMIDPFIRSFPCHRPCLTVGNLCKRIACEILLHPRYFSIGSHNEPFHLLRSDRRSLSELSRFDVVSCLPAFC